MAWIINTVTISNFDKRLLIEQVRYIEAEQVLSCDTENTSPDPSINNDFEHRLWQRAQRLVDCHNLPPPGRAARLSRYANTVALIVAALLGALGVNYAVTDAHTINIYWLLLILLGFNFLSILILSFPIESILANNLYAPETPAGNSLKKLNPV